MLCHDALVEAVHGLQGLKRSKALEEPLPPSHVRAARGTAGEMPRYPSNLPSRYQPPDVVLKPPGA